MTKSTLDMLTEHVDNVAETVAEYARQIESGEYGNVHTVTNADDDSIEVKGALDDNEAMTKAFEGGMSGDWDDWSVERNEFDEPTIVDDNGNEAGIYEWPLSVEVKIGRPLAVVIGTGGPHIEIVQEIGGGSAKLAGYWGGDRVYRHGPEFQTVLDYFTDDLYDQVPEEYK